MCFLYAYIFLCSHIFQTCTKFFFFLKFSLFLFELTNVKKYFLVMFFSRWHFGTCLPNALAVGGKYLAPIIIDVIVPVGSICRPHKNPLSSSVLVRVLASKGLVSAKLFISLFSSSPILDN
jgi:hypothetical protein